MPYAVEEKYISADSQSLADYQEQLLDAYKQAFKPIRQWNSKPYMYRLYDEVMTLYGAELKHYHDLPAGDRKAIVDMLLDGVVDSAEAQHAQRPLNLALPTTDDVIRWTAEFNSAKQTDNARELLQVGNKKRLLPPAEVATLDEYLAKLQQLYGTQGHPHTVIDRLSNWREKIATSRNHFTAQIGQLKAPAEQGLHLTDGITAHQRMANTAYRRAFSDREKSEQRNEDYLLGLCHLRDMVHANAPTTPTLLSSAELTLAVQLQSDLQLLALGNSNIPMPDIDSLTNGYGDSSPTKVLKAFHIIHKQAEKKRSHWESLGKEWDCALDLREATWLMSQITASAEHPSAEIQRNVKNWSTREMSPQLLDKMLHLAKGLDADTQFFKGLVTQLHANIGDIDAYRLVLISDISKGVLPEELEQRQNLSRINYALATLDIPVGQKSLDGLSVRELTLLQQYQERLLLGEVLKAIGDPEKKAGLNPQEAINRGANRLVAALDSEYLATHAQQKAHGKHMAALRSQSPDSRNR